jgi:hypothetical protein
MCLKPTIETSPWTRARKRLPSYVSAHEVEAELRQQIGKCDLHFIYQTLLWAQVNSWILLGKDRGLLRWPAQKGPGLSNDQRKHRRPVKTPSAESALGQSERPAYWELHQSWPKPVYVWVCVYVCYWGLNLASNLVGRHSYHLSHVLSPFTLVISWSWPWTVILLLCFPRSWDYRCTLLCLASGPSLLKDK